MDDCRYGFVSSAVLSRARARSTRTYFFIPGFSYSVYDADAASAKGNTSSCAGMRYSREIYVFHCPAKIFNKG